MFNRKDTCMLKQKKRLILFVSMLLTVGFLLTSLFSYFVSIASLRYQLTAGELPLTGDNIYSEIQRDLLPPILISSLMASDTFLYDWAKGGEKDQRAIVRYLTEIKLKYGAVTAFFVSENTRKYYHPSGVAKQVRPQDERDDWYFRVRELKQDYEINVDIDENNQDNLTVFINYRVLDYDGIFIGVVGIGLAVEKVKERILAYQKQFGRSIIFMDSKGEVMLNSDLQAEAKDRSSTLFELIKSESFLNKINAVDSISLEYELDNYPVFFNVRYIEEFDWYLVVIQSELEGQDKLTRALVLNLLFCAVVVAVVLLITNRTLSLYQLDIEEMATTDKLTGLYNRQAFDMLFDSLVLDLKRVPDELSLLLLDIDHFKKINDSHGHLAGDAVLVHIAGLIKSRLRETDIKCRWGGEEFMVLLKGCDLKTAMNMAEELRLGILNHPLLLDGKNLAVTVSVGVTVFQQKDNRDEIIRRADRALYTAKSNGRNQVVAF